MSAPAKAPEALCAFELQLLRSMCGLEPPMPWGAAVSAALETLKAARLVKVGCDGKSLIYSPTADGELLAREVEL